MDLALIIAVVGTAISLIGVVIAMMFWARTEANSLRKEQKEDRKDLISLVRAIENEVRDFHSRLFEIEKGRK